MLFEIVGNAFLGGRLGHAFPSRDHLLEHVRLLSSVESNRVLNFKLSRAGILLFLLAETRL